MTNAKPWLYKEGKDKKRLYFIMSRLGEVLRIGGIMAQPFLPVKAKEMLDALGVAPWRRTMKYAEWKRDRKYGAQVRSNPVKPVQIFPRLVEPGSEQRKETLSEFNSRMRRETYAMERGKNAKVTTEKNE
jgi:methionyl-tRNA synthetase